MRLECNQPTIYNSWFRSTFLNGQLHSVRGRLGQKYQLLPLTHCQTSRTHPQTHAHTPSNLDGHAMWTQVLEINGGEKRTGVPANQE